MAENSNTVWIIVGRYGPYEGASSKRWYAIADHVNALDANCHAAMHTGWGGLSEMQKAAWKECQKKGDRAVKATLTWKD